MALKKRNDGRYKATYTYNGKRHYFYGSTRNEAIAKREAYILALKKAPNMDASVTLSEWLDEYYWTLKRGCHGPLTRVMKVSSAYTSNLGSVIILARIYSRT